MKINWFTLLFVTFINKSQRFRQKLWCWVYNKIVSRDKQAKFLFMNYGYEDEYDKQPLHLEPEDEPFRYFIQLYDFIIKDLNLMNKDVMEVGSGRGGGGAFLICYKQPRSFIGVDLSEKAINWCNKFFQFKNTRWLQASADALPVANKSIDVIINVESSHCYPSMEKFLSEVRRTLRSNGYLAFCDLRPTSKIKNLDEAICKSGLEVVKHQEITRQVLSALNHISATREAQIASVFPKLFCAAVRDFAAIKGSVVYKMLDTGQMKYFFYLLKKSPTDEA